MTDKELKELQLYGLEILKEVDKLNISGVLFYDMAILRMKHSLNLKTDLVAVYDGTETDKYSDEFTTSIRTTLDIIALNKDTTSEELLSNAEYDTYLKEQVSSVVTALNEIKAVCTKSDSEFVTGLGKILDENNELFTNATTNTTTTTNTNVSASNTTLTEDVTVPGATELA